MVEIEIILVSPILAINPVIIIINIIATLYFILLFDTLTKNSPLADNTPTEVAIQPKASTISIPIVPAFPRRECARNRSNDESERLCPKTPVLDPR